MSFWLVAGLASDTVAKDVDNAAARDYNSAAALQNAGLHQRALTKWADFIAKYPQDERVGRATYYLGVCELRQQKFKEAAERFQNVLAKWPDLPQADRAQYNLAMARYELAIAEKKPDAFRQAASDFASVVSKFAQSEFVDDALYYQADSLFNAGDTAAAIAPLSQLVDQHATSRHTARAVYDLGTAQQELGKRGEAIAAFQKFLGQPAWSSHELAAEVQLRLGICLYDEGKLSEAIGLFGKAAEAQEFALADYSLYRMGQTQLQHAQFKQASETLKDFAKRFPQSNYRNEAAKVAGQAFLSANNPEEATRVLTPVANGKQPPAAEAAYWLGRALIQLKQYPRAISQMENAIGNLPQDPFVTYLKFARIDAIFEMPERRQQAPPLYEQFLREHPEHEFATQAHYMAALAYFDQKTFAKSRELAVSYLDIPKQAGPQADETLSSRRPEMLFVAAESTLLEMPGDAGARRRAEQWYRELIDQHPKHQRVAQSALRVGWCLNAAGQFQQTIDWLKPRLQQFSKSTQLASAYALIGQSHQSLNQHQQAVSAFEEIVTKHAQWTRLDEALFDCASSYRVMQQWSKAQAHLERLVQTLAESPIRAESMYALGNILQQQQDLDGAMNWFRQIGQQYADTEFGGPAMQALAALHLKRDQFNEARDWSTRVIDGQAREAIKLKARYIRGSRLCRFREPGSRSSSALRGPVGFDHRTETPAYASSCRQRRNQLS